MKNELCTSCKYRIAPDGWAACDGCIHDEGLKEGSFPYEFAWIALEWRFLGE